MSLIYPIAAQIFLTMIVTLLLMFRRLGEIKKNKIRASLLHSRNSSAVQLTDTRASDNYLNLFELPVLFYVISLLLVSLNKQSALTVYLMWGFVVFRYLHSYIHCTYNKVLHRFYAFIGGSIFLFLLFIDFLLKI